jgi:acetyltransferase-like isoleucine patch superfamily enzyme
MKLTTAKAFRLYSIFPMKIFMVLAYKRKALKPLAKFMLHSKIRVLLFKLSGYSIGKNVFIGEDLIITDNLRDKNVIIKDRVAISPKVTFITSYFPNFSRIRHDVEVNGKIEIEKDAWIGAGVITLPNIRIGEGAVVGAGAVVTKDVPPYTVVVGVLSEVIRKLEVKNEIAAKPDSKI